ncbi:MAG: hypothetical protein ACUVTO_07950 [Candidatus Caldatribacteriaceae bacterium]
MRGTITVTNGGAVETKNLKLVDQVQYKTGAGQFQDLPGATQTINPPKLASGATGTYDYKITFTPVPGATYRNAVKVTITNHSGHLGEEFGPEPKADFSLPSSPTIIDKTASVEDKLTCPSGFTCNIADSGYPEWENIGADSDADPYIWTVTYTLTPDQGNTICTSVQFDNIATLTESDTKVKRTASAGVAWDCALPPSLGCTYTLGYWKNHLKAWDDGIKPYDSFFSSG